jgi:hypothetical protein
LRVRVRRHFWWEAIPATICGVLTIVSIVWPGWIEGFPGVSPVRHNGAAEAVMTIVFAVLAVELTVAAWAEWRCARSAPPSA